MSKVFQHTIRLTSGSQRTETIIVGDRTSNELPTVNVIVDYCKQCGGVIVLSLNGFYYCVNGLVVTSAGLKYTDPDNLGQQEHWGVHSTGKHPEEDPMDIWRWSVRAFHQQMEVREFIRRWVEENKLRLLNVK